MRGAASLRPVSGPREKFPLDMGEKSAIVKNVDENVAPDQPPSTPHIVAAVTVRRTSSGSVFLFDVPSNLHLAPARATLRRRSPGLTH